jgi:hypothetical protein
MQYNKKAKMPKRKILIKKQAPDKLPDTRINTEETRTTTEIKANPRGKRAMTTTATGKGRRKKRERVSLIPIIRPPALK